MNLRELREKRAKLIKDAKAINDAALAENRSLSEDEDRQFSEMMDAADGMKIEIDRAERVEEATRSLELTTAAEDEERARQRAANPDLPGLPTNQREVETLNTLVLDQFRNFMLQGERYFIDGHGRELRNLSAGVDLEGGFIVAPSVIVEALIKAIDDEVLLRRLGTTISVPGVASIGAVSLDADPEDGEWTTELSTGTDDQAMAFGRREMIPHLLVKRIKVSTQLLRTSAIPVEQIVRQRLDYKMRITQEKAHLTGNGDKRPLGLFTASADGIPTSRDVATDNTTTAVTLDGLKNAKYSLKGGYWANAQWIFHRDVIKQIAKIKDLNDQYIWQESVRDGEPDRLLNAPVNMSEFAPNTLTAGLYAGILGDFSHYWIVDSMLMEIQRLQELYAEKNQVGFFIRSYSDGMPVLGEAFARVTLAP